MAETIKKVLEIEVEVDSGDVKAVNKELISTKKEIKQTGEATSGMTSKLDKMTGGAISGFKGMLTGIKSIVLGFKTMKGAIAATGIGLLIIAVGALTAAFTSSEEGQNKFAKIMAVIGSITGNLIDLLSDIGEKIIWAFENPKQAITDFVKLIQDNIVNRFVGLLELIPQIGKAISLLFKGEFTQAGKVAFDAVAKVTTGVEGLSDKIADATKKTTAFIDEMLREAKIAQEIADNRAKADKKDRELIVKRAEADRTVAELREKALDRERFNTSERIAFLNEASKVEEDITNKEIESAILRRDALIAENKLSKSNKDALNAEEEAKAAVINLETKRLNLQKALTSQISSLKQQEKAENKAISDARIAQLAEEEKQANEKAQRDIENETKRMLAIEAIRKSFAEKLQDLEDTTELQKIERQQSRALLELESLNATEEQKLETVKYFENLKKEAEEKARLEKEAADKKAAEEAIALAEREANAKQNIQNSLFAGLRLLTEGFGKQSEAQARRAFQTQKALGIAEATINTGKAVTAALTAGGNPLKLATGVQFLEAAAAAIAGGVQIATIARQQFTPSGGSGGGGSSSVSAPTAQVLAPQFNTVGASGVNQLDESINSRNNTPVKAYVVSTDVSSAQSLDRKRVDEASFP